MAVYKNEVGKSNLHLAQKTVYLDLFTQIHTLFSKQLPKVWIA